MWVELRDGERYLCVLGHSDNVKDGTLLNSEVSEHDTTISKTIPFKVYNDNLRHINNEQYDIMKIYDCIFKRASAISDFSTCPPLFMARDGDQFVPWLQTLEIGDIVDIDIQYEKNYDFLANECKTAIVTNVRDGIITVNNVMTFSESTLFWCEEIVTVLLLGKNDEVRKGE